MNSPNASVGVPTGAAAAPDTNPAGGGVKPVLGGMSLMRRMALMFGKDTEEQV